LPEREKKMRRLQPWQILIGIFIAFWLLFATIIIISGFPFLVISIALTTLASLSALIVLLAWAYQNNF
jgi:hypothetical protein